MRMGLINGGAMLEKKMGFWWVPGTYVSNSTVPVLGYQVITVGVR